MILRFWLGRLTAVRHLSPLGTAPVFLPSQIAQGKFAHLPTSLTSGKWCLAFVDSWWGWISRGYHSWRHQTGPCVGSTRSSRVHGFMRFVQSVQTEYAVIRLLVKVVEALTGL